MTKEEILRAAMELEPAEREVLAEALMMSLGAGDRAEIDAAWLEEARRREATYRGGTSGCVPVDEVIERLQKKGARQ